MRIGPFFKGRSEPFRHVGPARYTVYIFLCLVQFLLFFLSGIWIFEAKKTRDKNFCPHEMQGNEKWKWFYTLTALVAPWFACLVMLVFATRHRFKRVFLQTEMDFTSFTRRLHDMEHTDDIPKYGCKLEPIVQKLRSLTQSATRNNSDGNLATHFLLSSNGQKFLKNACRRMRNLNLLDNRPVRFDFWKQIIFGLMISLCCSVAIGGAYTSAGDCTGRTIFLEFLQQFSVTVLAVFAVSTFAGLTEYAQLCCVSVERYKLTEDEKFIISLVAANIEGDFSGVAKTEFSDYANILEEGKLDVFVSMHKSLFVYRRRPDEAIA